MRLAAVAGRNAVDDFIHQALLDGEIAEPARHGHPHHAAEQQVDAPGPPSSRITERNSNTPVMLVEQHQAEIPVERGGRLQGPSMASATLPIPRVARGS
jgi:hypothetical protein